MKIFDKLKKLLKKENETKNSKFLCTSEEANEDDIRIYALRFLQKECKARIPDIHWFIHKTNAHNIVREANNNDDSLTWIVYETEEDRAKAYEIAKERYKSVELEEDIIYFDKNVWNKTEKDEEE